MGALRLVGSFSEGAAQQYVDQVINLQQEAEGLVASFCHVDDGDVPSGVFSVGPGDSVTGSQLTPPLHQQLMEGMPV